MKHCQRVLNLLFSADHQPSKAVQPEMRPFHDPAPRAIAGDAFLGRRLFVAPPDVGGVAWSVRRRTHVVVVALVQAQMLLLRCCRRQCVEPAETRTFNHHRLQRGLNQRPIVAMGAIHCDRQGNAASLGQPAALDAAFPAVGRIGTGPFSPPRALWSSPHPSLATPRQCRPAGQRRATRRARAVRTPRRAPTRGSGRRPCWTRPSCVGTPSIGNRRQRGDHSVHGLTVWHPRSSPFGRGAPGRQERLDGGSYLVRNAPSVINRCILHWSPPFDVEEMIQHHEVFG